MHRRRAEDGEALERDGSVSVVGKSAQPRIIDIKVESGVQTVRLELA